jgi:hypothetical protein
MPGATATGARYARPRAADHAHNAPPRPPLQSGFALTHCLQCYVVGPLAVPFGVRPSYDLRASAPRSAQSLPNLLAWAK